MHLCWINSSIELKCRNLHVVFDTEGRSLFIESETDFQTASQVQHAAQYGQFKPSNMMYTPRSQHVKLWWSGSLYACLGSIATWRIESSTIAECLLTVAMAIDIPEKIIDPDLRKRVDRLIGKDRNLAPEPVVYGADRKRKIILI